jgi:isopropylmalate/homocitrate/citramalate synthase
MSLKCLYGVDVGLNTELFHDTAKFVCKIANNHAIPVNRPILGDRVFKVESGIGVMFATNAAKAGDMEILYSFNPALVGQPPMDFVMGKKSGTFTVNLWLERIGRTGDEQQNQDILAKVKELALKKRELLTKEEFVEIVNKVLGPPAQPPKPGNPLLDQQVSRAGRAWLESKKKAAGTK